MDFFNITKNVVTSGGNLITKGVSTIYDTCMEDSKMLNEINRINSKCKAIVEEFNHMKQDFDRDFEREHSEYIALADKIKKQLETFDVLSKFLLDVNDNPKEFISNNIKKVTSDIEAKIEVDGKQSLITGGIAGIATGAGTVGLVTMFGTAGTGAALSTLTGSAYVHATLAALGGGTLASGGLGMLGGLAVLSATFLAPAVAVASYIANKEIRKAYDDAIKRDKEADSFLVEGQEFLKRYAKGVNTFRYINREIYAFSNFFEELLNMAVATPALQKTTQYFNILTQAAKTIVDYEQLNFIKSDNSFNDNIAKEIADVKSEALQCQDEFYNYRAGLTPAHQNLLDELRQQKILNDKLQTEINWQKNNQPQNYIVRNRTIRNEFNKALQISTEELDIISAWMNFNVVNENLQQSFENLLRRGVTIKILYGIGDMGLFTIDSRNRRTNEVVAHLKARFSRYPNFKMKCTNTHDKLFICDEKFYVHSSMNILSFSAEYNNDDVREEGGEASNNLQLIREYRQSLFNF